MKSRKLRIGVALAALAISLGATAAATPAAAQTAARPAETVNLSKGTGTLVRLASPMTDVFIANDTIADVQVRSASQLYVFGKDRGETTVYATGRDGRVVYAANIRVGMNIGSIDEMLRLAMPEADVRATWSCSPVPRPRRPTSKPHSAWWRIISATTARWGSSTESALPSLCR